MNTPINLDHLFSISVDKEGFIYDDAFKKAALLYYFSTADLEDYPAEKIAEVLESSCPSDELKTQYLLNDQIRIKIIAEEVEHNTLQETVNRLGIDSELSKTLMNVMYNPDFDYKTLSNTELFYLINSLKAFPNRFNENELKAELNKKYFLQQFEKITRNFAGRSSELAELNDYVNWLPSRTLIGRISNTIRNVINWYDKPPLIIQGVGGIGKSALLSKFILEQNVQKEKRSLPFIYIDFDLPGFNIKEPLSILIESLRQLSIQFYEYKYIFDDVSAVISGVIEKNNLNAGQDSQSFNSSISSTRSVLFHELQTLIGQYSLKLDGLDSPILLVFDSFEEMQFRSSRDEMNNFLSFIKEMSEKLPRIRPVFSGRAELEEQLDYFSFQFLRIKDFDKESAVALLLKNGIESTQIAEEIFRIFGGTPLMLHMAMNMVKNDPESLYDFSKIKNQKSEYLVQRILEHIHDEKVQKIAVPGMLIRRISPEIIKEVLAKPCGLDEHEDTAEIFEKLKKETMLISKSSNNDEIVFRPDLRMACVPLIKNDYIVSSRQIEANIINYYKTRIDKGVLFEAEYYFHLLKKGSIPSQLTADLYSRIRNYIGYSFQEFPRNVQAYLHSLLKTKASDRLVNAMSDEEWEVYYLMLLKTALNGDLAYLRILNEEVELGKDRIRSSFSEFIIYHALLHQRLGKWDTSTEMIDQYIKGKIPPLNVVAQLNFIKLQNLEYQNSYEAAKVLSEHLLENRNELPDMMKKAITIQYKRIHKRFHLPQSLESILIDELEDTILERGLDKTELNENEFQYTNWNFILADYVPGNTLFKPSDLFNEQEMELRSFIEKERISSNLDAQNFDKLEIICNHILGIYTQSLSLTGEYEVVIKDFLYALEIKNIKLDFNQLYELFKRT
ncbi:ATP-binding protein [Chryseobacterium sp. JM1]|uniref:ATP-binding protein n=1 Tax=Chryseobacterium sp. JM1 TaxID=1233950 RepID=UPI0004E63B26|nr:ATP-binding protein [Chryseobacterium sp. JM1]KFF21663.1 hypothetical protein IW22_06900 [Chryseobacterium sp. JM1]